MPQILALIPDSVSEETRQSLKQSQLWQELGVKYLDQDIKLVSCNIFSAEDIQNKLQQAEQVLFIGIESLISVRLSQADPVILHTLAADALAHALCHCEISGLLYVALNPENSMDDTVWQNIFDFYHLQFKRYEPQTPFVSSDSQPISEASVCSVQVLPVIPEQIASWYIATYYQFLNQTLWPFIRIQIQLNDQIQIYLNGLPWPLLELTIEPDKTSPEHVVYIVAGGLLAQKQTRLIPRLELRLIKPLNQAVLALYDFVPALPWGLYLVSQAWIHVLTVNAFKRHLATSAV